MEEIYRKAAKLFHSVYPHSNFYRAKPETQAKFIEAVK